MATYKTKGIVIKRQDFFEADRLVTIFGRELGKLRVIAKGVRKILSKLSGQIELFTLGEFVLAEGKNLDILISASILENFKNLRKNLVKTSYAFFLAELVDSFCQENQPHPEVFDLLLENFRYLDRTKKTSSKLLPWFSWRLVFILGFGPQLTYCVECQKKLEPKQNFLSFSKGGILCEKCSHFDKMSLGILPFQIKLLRIAAKKDFNFFKKIKLTKQDEQEFQKIVESYLKFLAEKEIKSIRFLKKFKL